MEVSLVIIALVLVFGPWVLIFVLFAKVGSVRAELERLQGRILARPVDTEVQPDTAANAFSAQTETVPSDELGPVDDDTDFDASDMADMAGEDAAPGQRATDPDTQTEPVPPSAIPPSAIPAGDRTSPAGVSVPSISSSRQSSPELRPHPARTAEALERSLASRWLVWLGAIAISLAGIFLTAYAIEQGLLGPAVRTFLGVLLGISLAIGGEWLRRRPFQRAIATISPDYVPPALSAAGVFVTYASLYVGYAFYDLYPPLVAFALLTIAGVGGVLLSLLQGWFVALLGLLGSFLTPALIPSEAPSALALFSYLLAILAATCAVVRYRQWWPLGYVALSLAALWSVIWFATSFTDGDALIVGGYALAVGALFQAVRRRLPWMPEPDTARNDIRNDISNDTRNDNSGDAPAFYMPDFNTADMLAWAGLVASGLMLFALVRVDLYSDMALVIMGVFAAATLWLGRREDYFDLGFAYAAALVCLLFGTWHLPHLTDLQGIAQVAQPGLKIAQPVIVPELIAFTRAMVLFGALFAAGGFFALWRGGRATVFAGVSAITPVVLLTIAYWRYLEFQQDVGWAGVAVALAVVAFFATSIAANRREEPNWRLATGLYAAAVTGFVGLAFAMTLEEAWLTVALAMQLPALAWIDSRLNVPMLRRIAEIMAAVVLARLVLNPAVLDYALAPDGLFSWILYGYGIPCGAFIVAAIVFAGNAGLGTERAGANDQRLVGMLEAGALAFFVLLISFQIRYWVSGSLTAPYDSFLEQSLQSLSWLSIAYVLMARRDRLRLSTWPVLDIGAKILFALSAAQILLVQLVFNNAFSPTWMDEARRTFIGNWPIFDYLLLAYLVPAGFAFAFHLLFRQRGWDKAALAAAVSALVLLFAYVTMEVRHWFQGATLQWPYVSDAESYAISAAWLALALGLLAAGIIAASRELRYASLAILLLAVAKVFLGDMAGLTDLYRVAAFLGLGMSLVGIGYVYQRFVFAETAGAAPLPPEGAEAAIGADGE